MAEFSPSIAAAAALLAATGDIAAENFLAFRAGIAACPFVNSVSICLCTAKVYFH
jgi:cyclin D6, plant